MKRLLLFSFLLLALAVPGSAQFSLPSSKPIVCSGPLNNCQWPVVTNGYTGVIIARQALGQPIVVYGQTVLPDYVGTFTEDSIYHFAFNGLPYPTSVNVKFPPNTGFNVFLLLYEGTWQFSKGATADYSNANTPFPDCTNGQDCPYWWTRPIVPEKGDLLIAFANSNASGCGVYRPGPGWAIEAVACVFVVEDKIAAVEAPDIGSMYASMPDGSDSGGSHWLMSVASYSRVK